MTFLLPFLDGASLNQLCVVNKKWCDIVRDFVGAFNKVLQLTVSQRDNIFHFLAERSTKLVKLELMWSTGSRMDNQFLRDVISNNKEHYI